MIAANTWASQVVGAQVLKDLLDRIGQRAELKPVAADLQVAALGEGELHVQAEIRESVTGEAIDRAVQAKRLRRVGYHDATTREGWWYPEYAAGKCPGLPRWEALNACARVFDGRVLDGPKTWRHHEAQRIEALKLDYRVANADSAEALLAEVPRAWAERRPILMFRWSPHWMELEYPGRFVEFPPFDPNCITDPAWGPNPHAIYDCDLYRPGRISKVVWSKFPERFPCAYEVVKRLSFSSHDLAAMEEMVAVRKLAPEEAASRWLRENETRVASWIPKCRAAA